MRAWLQRAARNTALRAEEPRNRFARWTARSLAPTPSVPASRFQATDDPYPGHWREPPAPWPPINPAADDTRAAIHAALEELPDTWREVILARDAHQLDPTTVTERLGLAPEQERAILNRARARVRARLARRVAQRGS
jgi:DNA-directed RNA polymerase specialized sigma24 family protein